MIEVSRQVTIDETNKRDLNVTSDQLSFDQFFLSTEYANAYLSQRYPGITLEALREHNRSRDLVLPRQDLMRHYGLDVRIPSTLIGEFIQRDHATVLHALHKSQEEVEEAIARWKAPEARGLNYVEQRQRDLELEQRQKEYDLRLKDEKERRDEIFAQITVERVAHHYGVPVEAIVSESTKKTETQPRKTSVHIIRDGTHWSWLSISNYMGRKDHSTAMHFYYRVERRLKTDPEYKERYDALKKEINLLTERTLKMPQVTA